MVSSLKKRKGYEGFARIDVGGIQTGSLVTVVKDFVN